jgi:hypothetical protein
MAEAADVDLRIPGLSLLAFVTERPDEWRAVRERLHATGFLRREGAVVTVGPPRRAGGALLATCREAVRRFHRFAGAAARAYFERPELRRELQVDPLLEPLIEIDREADATAPLARLECVLAADGSVHVVEIDPVGVDLLHLRSLLYLVRGLWRAGLRDAADEVDAEARSMVSAFDRHYRAHSERPRERPTVGALSPRGSTRATHLLLRGAFRRMGWEYVSGGPDALTVGDGGIELAGVPVDLLWGDLFFRAASEEARQRQSRSPPAIGEYGSAPAQAAALLADRRFLDHLRSRRVVSMSPGSSYLALPRSLLAWIHDAERPVPAEDREWLARHVARTFSGHDRRRGLLSLPRARAERERLLIKPCHRGGPGELLLGRDVGDGEWLEALEALWSDDAWVVQEFWPPAHAADGRRLSLGLAGFDGELGGIALRMAATAGARDVCFVPVVVDEAGAA